MIAKIVIVKVGETRGSRPPCSRTRYTIWLLDLCTRLNIEEGLIRLIWMCMQQLKGHWTTSASSPNFFQKSWDFYTIRSVYLCSDCMLNLTCNFNSVTKIFEIFFQQPFLKVDFLKWLPLSWLLNLAPSTIILVCRKILKLVCAVLWTETKSNWTLCKLWHFGLE